MNLRTQKHTFQVRTVYDWKIRNIFRHFSIFRIVNSTGLKWDKRAAPVDGKKKYRQKYGGKTSVKATVWKSKEKIQA